MRILIASDLHGSAEYGQKLLTRFREEKADRLVLLGDLLYHGARNDLPEGYNTRELYELLNEYADKITAVRGNCDSEIDQMVLTFPMSADFLTMNVDDRSWILTHGHIFNEHEMISHEPGSVLLTGHTHCKVAEKIGDFYHINPGSVSIPKDGSHSYALYENGVFQLKELFTKEVLSEIRI